MGKRKGRKTAKPAKKYSFEVPKVFQCPFCNHDKAVDCKIDSAKNIANLECRHCKASYQAITNPLTEPIDVYSEWIDECEALNN